MVTRRANGEMEFRVFRPEATSVELLGSFTGWHDHPIAMQSAGDGWWTARLPLDAGGHEFQYLVDRRWWLADYAASGVRLNEFGTWVGLLHVADLPAPPEPIILGVRAGQRARSVA